MKTWLLMAVEPSERTYKGHLGYEDAPQTVYRYDSFVPNHRQLAVGHTVIIRSRSQVIGSAIIDRIDATSGLKKRNHCPVCNATKLKERSRQRPRYRCECGAEFDQIVQNDEDCTLYAARYGNSFQALSGEITISQLWALAPRLNKQLAMLELDSHGSAQLLARVTSNIGRADEPTEAARMLYGEGERTTVLVNRYERDPRARMACLDYYGNRCIACNFSFAERYGELGQGVIEVHHLNPLAGNTAGRLIDPIRDLRPLCSNCHTIVHQQTPPMTIENLVATLAKNVA
jgi:RNA polymerase subunit RPABC4/transcription elongation factor Spt4